MNQPNVFSDWLRTLNIEHLEHLHAEMAEQLAMLEREVADRGYGNARVPPAPAAREFYFGPGRRGL